MALNTSSLAFNGSTRYAKLSTNASIKNLQNFTWMARLKVGPLSKTPYQRAYVERQGSGTGIRFACVPYRGKLRFEVSAEDGRTDTNYDYAYTWDNRWHHVAYVGRINGATPTYEMYIDATKVASGTFVKSSGINNVSNTNPLGSIYLGNHSLAASGETFLSDRYWDGKIDDIILFNTAKSQGDILTYFTSNDIWGMSDTEMISYWRFDENTGSTTEDSDNAGWTGTLYSGVGVPSGSLWTIDRPYLGNGTADTTAPSAPTLGGSPTTNITADGFTATWIASTDNIYVQFYELHVSTVSNFLTYTTHNTDTDLTKAVTGLLPATVYYWRVRAVDAASNTSTYTTTQSLTTSGSGDIVAPLAPTALVASSVSHSSFTVSYTQSASSDETGYKIDVGLDSKFTKYLAEFRNKDVGNVVSTVVSGTSPLTTYYVRVRAYDAAGNESADSSTLVVQTPTKPDVVPPLEVVLSPATSVTSRAFTANWEETYDNIGVTYYVLDVSTASDFSSYVSNPSGNFNNKNVGNVTSYRVDSLSPNTTYYYRVRAYDAASNVSVNPSGQAVTTTPNSIEDGGFLNTVVYARADATTNSAATTTNYGTDTTLEVVGNGASNTKAAYLQFDLSTVGGVIMSAVLNLYVTNASVGSIAVSADNVNFDEATINWSNQPALAGATLNINPSSISQWVAVDIASLLLDGNTTYTVKLTTTNADNVIFSSREGSFIPYIDLDHDPSTATDIQETYTTALDGVLVNQIKNPSFNVDTTGWSIVQTGTTISRSTSITYNGIASLQVLCDGTLASQGAFVAPATSGCAAVQGETITVSFWARSLSGAPTINYRIYEYNVANSNVAVSSSNILTLSTTWKKYSVTYTIANVAAVTAVPVIFTSSAQATTYYLTQFVWSKTKQQEATFDGNTSGAYWSGSTNASTSKINTGKVTFESSYIGDSNSNNSVVALFKRITDARWIRMTSVQTQTTINRSTKRVSSLVGSSYGLYNLIENPSLEVDTVGWTAANGAGSSTISRSLEDSYKGDASLKIIASAHVDVGVTSKLYAAVANDTFGSNVRVRAPIGLSIKLVIQALNSGGTVIGSSTTTYGESATIGDDTWTELYTTYTAPALTANVRIAVLTDDTDGGTFYVDTAMLNSGLWVNPYRDGTYDDARWEGAAHNSMTALLILPETAYHLKHVYTDTDGVYDNLGSQSGEVAIEYTTFKVPDNVTTAGTLTLTPSLLGIDVNCAYSGDDNANNSVKVEYKRTDLSAWTQVAASIGRTTKQVRATIGDLKSGTSYTVRVTFADTDGVYGGVSGVVTSVATTLTDYGASTGASRVMFGGFTLFDGSYPTSNYGVVSHDAFGFPKRRIQVEDLPLSDGGIELLNVWGSRDITMRGFVAGETRGGLEANLDTLKKALSPKLQPLVIDTLGTSGRFYTASCEDFNVEQEGEKNNVHLLWTAKFVCADPFAYDASLSSVADTTYLNNATFTVNNGGSLKTPALIRFYTTDTKAASITIINNTTGERITPQQSFLKGDRLIVDSGRYSLTKNGVDITYSGGFINLNSGPNTFKILLTATSGTPSVVLSMEWRQKYL